MYTVYEEANALLGICNVLLCGSIVLENCVRMDGVLEKQNINNINN